MRRAAALFALAGCNSWFGLDPTHEVGPDAPPTFGTAQVVYQVATTDTTGAPTPATYAPIEGLAVQIGAIDGPLAPATIDAQGHVAIPTPLLAAPWRLVYQIGGGVPVEHQWSATAPVVCVPRFGRLERTPVASADFVEMAPTMISAYVAARLITSGVFTETHITASATLGRVSFPFSNAVPLDGALGKPDGALGDWEMVVDYVKSGTESYGYAFAPAALGPSQAPPAVSGFQSTTALVSDKLSTLLMGNRFSAGLGPVLYKNTNNATHAVVGLVPAATVPALGVDGAFVVDLATYEAFDAGYKPINPAEVMLPRAVDLKVSTSRMAGAASLVSSIERLDLGTLAAYPDTTAQDVASGIASSVKLDDNDLLVDDGASLAAGPVGHTLAWTVAMGGADDAVVTLYRIEAAAPVPVHRYVTTSTTIAIEPGVLVPGSTYVFQIALRTGYPGAAAGDYRTVTYPLAMTRLFAATFTVH